jgi:hypothetical protein
MEEKNRYIAVVEQYDKQLVKVVNDQMKEGYEPYGQMVISFNEMGVIKSWVQMMRLKE